VPKDVATTVALAVERVDEVSRAVVVRVACRDPRAAARAQAAPEMAAEAEAWLVAAAEAVAQTQLE
jgi:hypothetical protein